MNILGIDIGGSGIKGAVVNTKIGVMLTERFRLPTPVISKPDAVAEVVSQIVKHFNWEGPVGCGVPSVVLDGVLLTASNIHTKWVGENAVEIFGRATGCPFFVINDADAAGIAEMEFGGGKGQKGTVLLLTLGTGIGSSIFTEGILVPNLELGHLKIRGKDAERRASDATRKRKNLSWEEWASRLQEYISTMEGLFWPSLIIIGGGVSKQADKFIPSLNTNARIIPAKMLNQAGIIGAALFARQNVIAETLR
jgi:polyphosphate glucokinase